MDDGQAELDGESELILVDLEPINEKLRKIQRGMKEGIRANRESFKKYAGKSVDKKQGSAYAQQFETAANIIESHLKEIEKTLPPQG